MHEPPLRTLIRRWREDPGGAYLNWFLWTERLKNFRSIRRGIEQIVGSIAEQRLTFTRIGIISWRSVGF